MPRFLILALSLVLASSARATTYVVDVNGSGDFTSIGSGIAASQPGDVLLVLAGNYSPFVLNKGLRIVGYGTVAVQGNASITGIPADEVAAMVRVRAFNLTVSNCSGPVIVQEIPGFVFPVLHSLDVSQSADVRLFDVFAASPTNPPQATAAEVDSARVEIVGCSFSGSDHEFMCCNALFGGEGLECDAESRAHVVRSSCVGGTGSDNDGGGIAGPGAPGIRSSGELILAGGNQSTIQGGSGGWHYPPPQGCTLYGDGASGVLNHGQLWYSGASVAGGFTIAPPTCAQVQEPPFAGNGTLQAVTPDDPTLAISGTPSSGQTVTLSLRAPAGASAILYFGRKPILVVDPAIQIEQLVEKIRVVNLGIIPPSGQVDVHLTIPSVSPAGAFIGAQAEITLQGGEVRRTNSVPMIIR